STHKPSTSGRCGACRRLGEQHRGAIKTQTLERQNHAGGVRAQKTLHADEGSAVASRSSGDSGCSPGNTHAPAQPVFAHAWLKVARNISRIDNENAGPTPLCVPVDKWP